MSAAAVLAPAVLAPAVPVFFMQSLTIVRQLGIISPWKDTMRTMGTPQQ